MMTDPILSAPPLVQLHLATALLALLAGPVALASRRRGLWHRPLGVTFALAMLVAALSSFGIREGGGFSWIHLLSVLALFSLGQGLRALWRGQPAAHGRAMRQLYAQALIVAGVLALLPGRRLSLALFPEAPVAGLAAAITAGVLVATLVLWPRAIPSFLRRCGRLCTRPSVTRMWRNW